MNKTVQVYLALLFMVLLSLLIPASFAENLSDSIPDVNTLYTIHSPDISEDELLKNTFGVDDIDKVTVEDRELGSKFWQIQDSESLPFCVLGTIYPGAEGIQKNVSIYRVNDETPDYNYYYLLDSWNTISAESGFSAGRASDTVQDGLKLLTDLGLTNAEAVSFSTLGRMETTVPCRKVIYRETLNQLPLYWSADCLRDENDFVQEASGCYAELIYSDLDGLLYVEADWCDFTPTETRINATISQKAAAERFAENGNKISTPELCYFMDIQNGVGTATLAWRVKTSFISAITGEWLQVDL